MSVTVTITGSPGEFYAVLDSSVNGGFSYAGVALGVGGDVAILAQGVLGGGRERSIDVVPQFNGSILDRYRVRWGRRGLREPWAFASRPNRME